MGPTRNDAHLIVRVVLRWGRPNLSDNFSIALAHCTSVVFITRDPMKFRGAMPLFSGLDVPPGGARVQKRISLCSSYQH